MIMLFTFLNSYQTFRARDLQIVMGELKQFHLVARLKKIFNISKFLPLRVGP